MQPSIAEEREWSDAYDLKHNALLLRIEERNRMERMVFLTVLMGGAVLCLLANELSKIVYSYCHFFYSPVAITSTIATRVRMFVVCGDKKRRGT